MSTIFQQASSASAPLVLTAARPSKHRQPPLAIARIVLEASLAFGLLMVNHTGEVGTAIFFAILIGMCCFSSSAAVKALAIMWIGLTINTAIVPKNLVWTPLRLMLAYVALARFLFDYISLRTARTFFFSPAYLTLIAYCAMMAVCSIASGWFTMIALLKLTNFFGVVTTMLLGGFVIGVQRRDPGEWFFSVIALTAAVGLLAIALGEHHNMFGYGKTHHFCGAFSHPNTHALLGSMFVCFLVAVYAYSTYVNRWMTLPVIATWLLFMTWSRSRTSFVATGCSLAMLLFFGGHTAKLRGWIRISRLSRLQIFSGFIALSAMFLVADVVNQGRLSAGIILFLNKQTDKGDDSDVFLDADAVLRSRSGLIDLSMRNFRESPIFGIGFQVAKTEQFARTATIFTAPAEKGFLPTAVLEEGGVLGSLFFVIWIATLFGTFLVQRNMPALLVFTAFFSSSITEVTLLSPGGAGSFGWLMVGVGWAFGELCWRERSLPGGFSRVGSGFILETTNTRQRVDAHRVSPTTA